MYAVRQRLNWDMKKTAENTMFSDDKIILTDGREIDVNATDLEKSMEVLVKHNDIPVYISAGICDSTGARRATEFYQDLVKEPLGSEKGHQLLLGPWGHGGRRGCETITPKLINEGTWSCGECEIYRDVARFIKNIDQRKPIKSKERIYIMNQGWETRLLLLNQTDDSILNQTDDGISSRLSRSGSGRIALGGPFLRLIDNNMFEVYLTHLFEIPIGLVADWKIHWQRRDLTGLAYDAAEIVMIIGVRWTHIFEGARTLLKKTISSSYFWIRSSSLSDRQVIIHSSENTTRIVDRKLSAEFSTTGKLSRWNIVQHLLRIPTDINHVLACSSKLTYIMDRLTGGPSKLEFVTPELARPMKLSGTPTVQIPLLFLAEDFQGKRFLDGAVHVILMVASEEGSRNNFRYLTEGRASLSSSFKDVEIQFTRKSLSNITDALDTELRQGWAADLNVIARNAARIGHLPLQDNGAPYQLTYVRIHMETVHALIPKLGRFKVIVMPDDNANFPWHKTHSRSVRRGLDIQKFVHWRIPYFVKEHFSDSGFLILPETS